MEDENGIPAKAAGGIVFAFLLYEFVAGTNTLYMFCSIAAVCAYGALIGQAARNTRKGTVCFALIACVLLSELSLTGKKQLQSSPNYEPDAAQYAASQALEETLTEQLKASDSSSYRINTARTVSIAKPYWICVGSIPTSRFPRKKEHHLTVMLFFWWGKVDSMACFARQSNKEKTSLRTGFPNRPLACWI